MTNDQIAELYRILSTFEDTGTALSIVGMWVKERSECLPSDHPIRTELESVSRQVTEMIIEIDKASQTDTPTK